jgi:hypothetical protein
MASVRPRNVALFNKLRGHFGKVTVMNAGGVFRCYRESLPGGQVEVHKLQGGEEYAVNCPACGDSRGRLYVNHMYGCRVHGVELDYLFHCYNEGSSCRWQVHRLLEDLMEGIDVPKIKTEDLKTFSLQDAVIESALSHAQVRSKYARRLDTLPMDHPANAYMLSRGFDPVVLANEWGCYYADDPNKGLGLAYRRIIIPLLFEGVTVGYQARAIPGFTRRQDPKYWTAAGTKKSFFLGGYDYARLRNFVVVVEGPTKKWRVGPPAVDILGKSLSAMQVELLVSTWVARDCPVVLVSDPGFEKDWDKNAQKLARVMPNLEKLVVIHPGQDVGDMTTEDVRRMIVDGCARQNCFIEF